MELDFVLDSSAGSAPSGFVAALNYVATVFDQLITNPITVTIDVGYGEIDGQAIEAGAVGESLGATQTITYAQALSALTANATSLTDASAVASLPAQNPFGSDQIVVTTAQEKALGLAPANGTAVDGYIGFDSTVPFEFNLNALGMQTGISNFPSTDFDFYAVAEHEVSEVLGRISALDTSGQVSILDLFRYASDGIRSTAAATAGYFSVDGGATNLATFNPDATQGDLGDWIWSANNPFDTSDAFSEGIAPGTVPEITSGGDTVVMDAIGYSVPSSIYPASTTFNLVQSSPTTLTLSGTVSGGVGLYSVELALAGYPNEHIAFATVNQTTGDWSLTIPAGTYLQDGSQQSFTIIARNLIGDGSNFELPSTLATELTSGGSGTIVFGGSQNYTLSMSGGSATVTDTTSATVHTLTAFETLEFTGGGDSIVFLDSSGDSVTLSNTDSGADTVTGSGGTVTLDNAQVLISGSDTVIGAGGSNTVVFQGDRSGYVISGNATTAKVTNVSTGAVDTLTGIQTLQFADVSLPSNYEPSSDFYGTGTSDILLLNSATGSIVDWQMNGSQVLSTVALGGDPAWTVVGTGDFYGTGTSDILLFNATTGSIVEWQMNNGQVASATALGGNPAWAVVGTGDFAGNGTSDILLENATTGSIVEWQMNGGQVASVAALGGDPAWSVVGTGDFTGNGQDDILLENASTGSIVEWQMNGSQIASVTALGGGAGWSVVGTGDFSGNGTSDILLQNATTGAIAEWQMNGGQVASTAFLGGSPGWNVAGTGDYFGNGHADILLQNASTGSIVQWEMNGSQIVSNAALGGNASWKVAV